VGELALHGVVSVFGGIVSVGVEKHGSVPIRS
jgi:hypothetical protein